MSDVSRIACVDDDVSVCKAMVAFLSSYGFVADAFNSAEAFLQSANVSDSWCLITEVKLPGMSGLQLQSRIADAGLNLPIIFITAFPDEMTQSRAMGAGAVGFFCKPVTEAHLLACINSARRLNSGRTF